MARKRKSDATHLDDVDRTLYSTFCSAANSLSQLYTQAMNHQKVAFQAGERQALEKLYQWIIKQHEEDSRVTAADIVAHIEKEIDYGGDDAAISPRLHFQHQFPQTTPHLTNSSIPTSTGFVGQLAHGVPLRTSHSEQVKNSVFSNTFSSPVRRTLQPYHLAQGEGPCGLWGTRSNDANSLIDGRECDSPNRPNDSSMEH
ncbi:uncharacterized protein LOC110037745 [Phalaenopsis equestris]|uniref:uncharacterized protein LOC110037745 n=1 Tax=Phalaenopsis equestris TaxID=78828 RepID=UPI0009E64307|nr:uncharacterized protein LOC110037745 [Phalaenopsis equestris]